MVEFAPFVMIVLIVAIVSWSRLQRAKLDREVRATPTDSAEAQQLRGEVRRLSERVQVLESIVTDGDHRRSVALEREIEALRAPERETRP